MEIKEKMEEAQMLPPQDLYNYSIMGTPVVQRLSDAPAEVGLFWLILQAVRSFKPNWAPLLRWMLAFAWFGLTRVAGTLHATGHIISARRVNAPVDAVVSNYGLMLMRYVKQDVTPVQHMGRAIGGPIMSLLMTMQGYIVWRIVRRIPLIRDLAGAWLISNAVIAAGALTPTPTFDGATLLRWGVTLRTGDEALGDEAVQQAGFVTAGALLAAAMVFALRRKGVLALGCAGFAAFIVLDLTVLRGLKA